MNDTTTVRKTLKFNAKTLNNVNLYNVQKSSDKSACKLINYFSLLYFTNENANKN